MPETRPHGIVTDMEEGQPERLFTENRDGLLSICPNDRLPAALLRLPYTFAQQVVKGECAKFLLPDFNSLVTTTKFAWCCNWARLGLSAEALPSPRRDFLAGHVDIETQQDASFELPLLQSVAKHLRSLGNNLLEQGPEHHQVALQIHADLTSLQRVIDELDPVTVQSTIRRVSAGLRLQGSTQKTVAYRAAFIIQVLLQCDLLKSDGSLKDSLKQALRIVLPKSLQPMFLDLVEQHINPSASSISRWRLLLDASLMLHIRAERRKEWADGRRSVRWLMIDSSPQGGRDYELVVMARAFLPDMPQLVSLVDIMNNLSRDGASEDQDHEEWLQQQANVQRQIAELITIERPPPVVLGSGRTSLPDKFAATVHALFLEAGSAKDLGTLMSEMASCTSDLGTEFNIVRVQGAKPKELLPWLAAPQLCEHEEDWPEEEEILSFGNALAIPGILHVLHNAAKRMLTGLPQLSSAVDALAAVADLVRKKHTQERLCERCFDTVVGRQFHSLFQAFQGKVHPGRWGTIAFATHEMLQIERPLRWGWNLALFLGGSADQASDQAVKATVVNEAILSQYWWDSLKVIDKLHKAIRYLFAWSEGCPCHGFVAPDHDPTNRDRGWEQLCERCPLRGRRCPDIACGDLLQTLRQQLDTSAAELLLNMSPNLTPEQQGVLLAEFEAGRSSLIFNIALKVSAMSVPPLLVFGVAHLDQEKAHTALRACLESDNVEGLMAELKTPHVRAEAEAWLAGENLAELTSLCTFLGKLRFAFSVERAIEGEHASIHHFIRKSPHHTVAYVSLSRRLPQIKAELSNPAHFQQIAALLETVRNPKLVVRQLGMAEHSSCAFATHPWDPIFGKIVYRSDPVTTQSPSAPINVEPLPLAGGGSKRQRQKQPLMIANTEDPEPPVVPAGNDYAQVLHEAALDHFKIRLQEECSQEEATAFSVFASDLSECLLFLICHRWSQPGHVCQEHHCQTGKCQRWL